MIQMIPVVSCAEITPVTASARRRGGRDAIDAIVVTAAAMAWRSHDGLGNNSRVARHAGQP